MIRRYILSGLAMAVASIASHPAAAQCALPQDMTGVWRANDGGTYYVRQVNDRVYWYGQSKDNGASWTNVFQGQRKLNTVVGTWADIPRGRTRSSGELHLAVTQLAAGVAGWKVILMTGGFAGSSWFMPCGDNQAVPNP